MGNIEVYLLLLFAVIAGWLLGRFTGGKTVSNKNAGRNQQDIFHDYFIGLNYLLNDEPDEAIDTFIRALEIDSDTIETHLALGALLRRRGKVDKAIKVHQTLLARPGLDNSFSDATRIQLALDYITAGLLDRAERLLKEILQDARDSRWEALQHLITIYQTEKEWEQAIDCSQQLLSSPVYRKDAEIRSIAAHYCCELALQAVHTDQASKARELIKRAFSFDRKHVRTSIVLATLEQKLGNYKQAIKELLRARSSRPEYTQLVIEPLISCHEKLGIAQDLESVFHKMQQEHPQAEVLLALTSLKQGSAGEDAAFQFLSSHLTKNATLEGVKELLSLQQAATGNASDESLRIIPEILDSVIQKRSAFQCNHCGYESKNLYWLCPSCQQWDTIKPKASVTK